MNCSRTYVGIDPGAKGAIAVICGQTVTIFDIPLTKAGKTPPRLDTEALLHLVEYLRLTAPGAKVTIEGVGGLPRQGGATAFQFGMTTGKLEMAFEAAGFAVDRVAPIRWKKHFRLIGKPKSDSIATARARFPEAAGELTRAKDEGRAEALLIAEWSRCEDTFKAMAL